MWLWKLGIQLQTIITQDLHVTGVKPRLIFLFDFMLFLIISYLPAHLHIITSLRYGTPDTHRPPYVW